jgi:hypothetical protein
MNGFFDDGRPDDALLAEKELAQLKLIGDRFATLAELLRGARTIADCKQLDKKVDELFEGIE